MRYLALSLFVLGTFLAVIIANHALGYVFFGEAMMPPKAPASLPELARVEIDTPIGHYRELIAGSIPRCCSPTPEVPAWPC